MIQCAGFCDPEVVQARRGGGALGFFGPAPTGARGPGGRPLPAGCRCDGYPIEPTWPSPPAPGRCSARAPAGADERLGIEASYNPHLLPGATRLEVVLTLTEVLASGWEVWLRLQTSRGCRITSVQPQSPERVELVGLGIADGHALDVPLGRWGSEARHYFVVADLPPQEAGTRAEAFRFQVLYVDQGAETAIDGGQVMAHWTADLALAVQVDPRVAYYNDQQELAESIRAGLAAWRRGDLTLATLLLGRAVQLSAALDNAALTRRLGHVVEVLDAQEGTVRLRPGVDPGALLDVERGRPEGAPTVGVPGLGDALRCTHGAASGRPA
jgi:hypothetical protein